MKAIGKALVALGLAACLTAGFSPPAQADPLPDPIWHGGSSFNCQDGVSTTSECAFYVVIRLVRFTNPDGCVVQQQAPEYCDKIASDEKTWLWKPVTTWDIAQAVLRGYQKVAEFPELIGSGFWETYANSLYAAAQARVASLFDPVTHEYLGPPPTKVTGATPTISDTTPTVDQTLTAQPGAWTPSGATFTYQWYYRTSSGSAKAIPGATGSTYQVAGTYAGYKLRVKVTGSSTGLASASMTSAWTSTVAKTVFAAQTAPTITFEGTTPRVGKVLTAVAGTFDPAATSHRYQWYRNGRAIKHATKATYKLTSSSLGKVISVRVKSYRAGYATVSQTISLPGTVQPGLVSASAKVSDTTPTVDQTSSALPRVWFPEGVSFTCQWYYRTSSRHAKAIPGATDCNYQVGGAYAGRKIRVVVTGSLADYAPVSRTSAWTHVTAKAKFTSTPVPVIDSPDPTVGQTLTASPGTWSPVPGSTSYQWYKVSRSGRVYAIKGATAATYQVKSADVGYRLKVTVTARKTGYYTVSKTSALTNVTPTPPAPEPTPTPTPPGTP